MDHCFLHPTLCWHCNDTLARPTLGPNNRQLRQVRNVTQMTLSTRPTFNNIPQDWGSMKGYKTARSIEACLCRGLWSGRTRGLNYARERAVNRDRASCPFTITKKSTEVRDYSDINLQTRILLQLPSQSCPTPFSNNKTPPLCMLYTILSLYIMYVGLSKLIIKSFSCE